MRALQTVAEFCDDHRNLDRHVLSLDAARRRASGHQARKSNPHLRRSSRRVAPEDGARDLSRGGTAEYVNEIFWE